MTGEVPTLIEERREFKYLVKNNRLNGKCKEIEELQSKHDNALNVHKKVKESTNQKHRSIVEN